MCVRFERELGKIERWARRLEAVSGPDVWATGEDAFPGSVASILTLESDSRQIGKASWGLLPAWSKDAKLARHTYNARAETVQEKPSFREAFRSRRCLVPATAFFERLDGRWIRIGAQDGEALTLAGLYEEPNGISSSRTFTVVTTEPNAFIEPYQDRLPVILSPDQCEAWLSSTTPPTVLKSLMVPCPDGWLVASDAGLIGKRRSAPILDL